MKCEAAVVVQASAGLALVSVSRQHARSLFHIVFLETQSAGASIKKGGEIELGKNKNVKNIDRK